MLQVVQFYWAYNCGVDLSLYNNLCAGICVLSAE